MQKKPQPRKLKKPKRQKLPKLAILGIDEVGRGPWAGPLVVGACVLGDAQIEGLTDSKKLTPKKREALAPIIQEKAAVGLGWVSAAELDELGMTAALCKACREAVKQIHVPFHEIIIDGTINFLRDTPLASHVQVLTKADLLVPEVSAASVVAKVARDNYMYKLAEKYPGYGFEKHVGYGTAAHRKALEELGVCPEHRKSFRPIAEMLDISSAAASGRFSARHCALCVSPWTWEQTVRISESAVPGIPIRVWLMGRITSPTTYTFSSAINAST